MKKKRKLNKKKVLLVVLPLVFIFTMSIFLYSKKLDLEYETEKEVLLYEEIYNVDIIKTIKNGKIISETEKIDTNHIGSVEVTMEIETFFKQKKEIKATIHVLDTEAPTITFQNELTTTKGTEIDLLKDVSATDNAQEEITVQVEGEYDFQTTGDYTLYYVAEDESGNVTKEEFTLHVKQPTSAYTKPDARPDATFTTSKGFKGETKNGVTYIDGYLIANKTYSLPSSYGNGLTAETTSAFYNMQAAAKLDGLNIYISSGFRSYSTQEAIYNRYVSYDGVAQADTYSARPGHSEHQTGLAFDVNTINDSFANTPEANWLEANCYKYGFILRYPKGKTNETGYKYEPWHFRYVGEDLATKLYNNGDWLTMEDYFGVTSSYS